MSASRNEIVGVRKAQANLQAVFHLSLKGKYYLHQLIQSHILDAVRESRLHQKQQPKRLEAGI